MLFFVKSNNSKFADFFKDERFVISFNGKRLQLIRCSDGESITTSSVQNFVAKVGDNGFMSILVNTGNSVYELTQVVPALG